ncbi:LLM class flavin-dependent oxidoreductase [Amycolatopsis suaedae]|uniref:LLM class flavin-dependent oxidoreductase n=1 Tax=Amycolatopsis suaedae TaxID=2510978 RepID=A0A4Q7IZK9_9PSEU|nr:LLM class flavin-dependent oxidoreductase [Amycolatopsis suaedae]RZQ59712.1 LLM class flavin-dependent oxidoreductase [Amycolatopsis suaedae]
MADFGREISSGYFLVPDAAAPLLDTARELDRLGYDYLGIQDHPYQRRYVDTFALAGMVLGVTSRITVFPDVANLALRDPAILAKTAASFDLLSGGRFELGLGTGAFWDAIEAFGGPRRTPGQALAAQAEAITVIRKLWSGERNLRFDGDHYRLAGAQSGPVPTRPIGIWLGSQGPKALRLLAERADGWVVSLQGDVEPIVRKTALLDAAAADAGRDPGEIRRVLNVQGPADAGQLTELAVGLGFDTFVLWAREPGTERAFAEEVLPAVREQVARERR